MTDIDDRLMEAATETRIKVREMDHHRGATTAKRHRTRQLVSGIGAFALVLVVFGVTNLVVNAQSGIGSGGTTPSDSSTMETTAPEVDDDAPEVGSAADPSESSEPVDAVSHDQVRPLGVLLPGWGTLYAEETTSGSRVFYGREGVVGRGEYGEWIAIEIFLDQADSPSGFRFQRAVDTLGGEGQPLPDVYLADGQSSSAFMFEDPDTGQRGFAFGWQLGQGATVEVLAYFDTVEEAAKIVQSIEALSPQAWSEILAEAAALRAP